MADYTYAINGTNFPASSGACNPKRLKDAIAASAIPKTIIDVGTVGGVVSHVPTQGAIVTGGTCTCTFDATLTAGEQTTLDGLVAAHVAQDAAVALASFMIDPFEDPRVVDYKAGILGRLHKMISSRVSGEVRVVDYYSDEAMTTLVIRVEVFADAACTTPGYARTGNGLVTERWTKRTWYRTDGTVLTTKVTHKHYAHDPVEQMREGRRRRNNVIDALTIDVLNMIVVTDPATVDPTNPTTAEISAAEATGMEFLQTFSDQVSNYIRTGDLTWKTPPGSPNIQNHNAAWLDYLTDTNANPVVAAVSASMGWTGDVRANIQAQLVEIAAPWPP